MYQSSQSHLSIAGGEKRRKMAMEILENIKLNFLLKHFDVHAINQVSRRPAADNAIKS